MLIVEHAAGLFNCCETNLATHSEQAGGMFYWASLPVTEKLGAPRSAYLLVAESATGKVLTQRILYRVLGLRW